MARLKEAGWLRVVLGALGLVMSLSGRVVLAQQGPARVLVVPVRKQVVPETMTLVGSVEPQTRSVIASELAGLVEEMPVEEGDRVGRGDVLCRLRSTTRQLLCDQAQASLAQRQAELEELEAGTRKEQIDRARAAMAEAQAIFERWSRELERVKKLRAENSASLKEYNDTVSDAAAAEQRFFQVKAAFEEAEAGPRKEDIARARFIVEAQKALLAKLKYDLDQTAIRAPFAGYVVQKHAEVGQWVTAGGSVVELVDLETVRVRIDVPESAISACKVGQEVPVFIEALNATFYGTIKHVIPQADAQARTFPVEVVVANQDQRIKSGMFTRARVPSGPTTESLMVSRDAVLERQGSHLVVAVVPGPGGQGEMGMPVPVELGTEVGGWVAVRSPMLKEGMPVVVKGHDRIYGPGAVISAPAEKWPATQPAATTQPVF